jgi:hypothetical protein
VVYCDGDVAAGTGLVSGKRQHVGFTIDCPKLAIEPAHSRAIGQPTGKLDIPVDPGSLDRCPASGADRFNERFGGPRLHIP